jgi:hypothetical protein
MQFLVIELAKGEGAVLDAAAYPLWTPYNAFEAANVLLEALKENGNA